jgi:DNA-binding LytR/AlgR family response regulator
MEINMKIAICDDCLTQLNELKDIISDINIVSSFDLESFTSPSFLLERCSLIGFDIVFLDVDMPEMNGIVLGKALHRISPRTILIFVTSYPEYAVEGYQCEALRYILKPYTKDEIFSALKRAIEIIGNQKHCVTVKNHNKPINPHILPDKSKKLNYSLSKFNFFNFYSPFHAKSLPKFQHNTSI